MSEVLGAMVGKPGRKKIVYNPVDLERTPLLIIVCGMKGVGKTHFSVLDIDRYVLDNAGTGKRGRKVLILDFNDEVMYRKYKAVSPKYIKVLTEPRGRRIIPIADNGKKYDLQMMRDVAEYVVFNFMNGLVVLEDIDKYMTGKKGQSLIGAMTTNRHAGMDLLITHQSVAKVSKTEWENAAFVRLHHQLDDVDRIKDDLPNYPLMKIAQIIVDKKYFRACQDYDRGLLDDNQFKAARSFFVYINMLEHKIMRATEEEFREATYEFIRMKPGLVSRRMKVGDENGTALNKELAIQSLYKDYLPFLQAA